MDSSRLSSWSRPEASLSQARSWYNNNIGKENTLYARKKLFFSDFWHCPHSMRSRIYVTVGCPSGICLSHHSTAEAACGGFAAESRAGRRYRPTAMAPQNGVGFWSAANADSAVLTAKLTRLNTDLLINNLPIVVGQLLTTVRQSCYI